MSQDSSDEKKSEFGFISKIVVESVCSKFLEHMPEEYRNDNMRIFFEVEMAHWFYVDHFVGNPEYPTCRGISFKDFTRLMFQNCSFLKDKESKCLQLVDEFNNYKQFIPTNGAMLIDKSLDYVLLVQGYFASKNSWGFPKGKVNEGEKSIECAIREVQEEVGYDIRGKINPKRSFSRYTNNKSLTQIFAVADVEMDFDFKPCLNKEIRKIQWFQIKYLPRTRNDYENPEKIGMRPNNFYNVAPFVDDLINFVNKEKQKRMKKEKKLLFNSPHHLNHTVSSPMLYSQQSYTGEAFMKLLTNGYDFSPPSPTITDSNKPPTVLVFEEKKLPEYSTTTSTNSQHSDEILNYEGPYSPPSSPANGQQIIKMNCEQATLAMAKLLKLKPKLPLTEPITRNHQQEYEKINESKTAPNIMDLLNSAKILPKTTSIDEIKNSPLSTPKTHHKKISKISSNGQLRTKNLQLSNSERRPIFYR